MPTPYELDDHFPDGDCGCGHCDEYEESWIDPEDIYDDPYEVVMYDIDAEPDDLYALIDMLGDSARSWYARRRLNALAASGPLSALVADIIIDSLGRRWDPLQHPRDRFGRFIETGGFIRWVMKGINLRGQVSRIDSDGNIHVRSVGNDSIADGAVVRFKPQQASKLISIADPVADLSEGRGLPDVDLDADIPDFPEASPVQKRIYNTLQQGDMPAADLDRAIDTEDLTGTDFAAEVVGLQDRGLIEIDKSGDKPRVRRTDGGGGDVVDVGDDEIDDVGDDESPELDDSPALTKAQRDLLDRLVFADRSENDGVRQDELSDVDEDDFQALVDAGVLVPGEDGNFFLENPEPNADVADTPSEPDLDAEIFEASKALNDPNVQDAFQHYAEELARPGDPNNIPLSGGISPQKRRIAETAANKWWAERNAGTAGDEETPDPNEVDTPEVEGPDPKDVLNPRNQAMADQMMAEYFPDEDFDNYLDTPEGEEYRGAIKRLFDAEDLEENGFDVQAGVERDKANNAMERVGVSPEDIEGWPIEVQNMRNADREGASEETGPDVVDEAAPVSDVVTITNVDGETEEVSLDNAVKIISKRSGVDEDAIRESLLNGEGFEVGGDTFQIARPETAEDVSPEVDAAEALRQAVHGVDVAPDDGNSRVTITNVDGETEEVSLDDAVKIISGRSGVAEYAIRESLLNGEGFAVGGDDFQIIRSDTPGASSDVPTPDENELLQRFMDRPNGEYGPEVMRLRRAGLIEDDLDNGWKLTDAGRERLGLVDETSEGDSSDVPDVNMDLDTWVKWSKRVNDERDLDGDINDELVLEKAVADELGLDLFAGNGLVNWNNFVRGVDLDVADALYRKHDGAIGPAVMDHVMNRDKSDAKDAPDTPDSAVDLVDEPQNDQARIDEEVRQNLIQRAKDLGTSNVDATPDSAVDLVDEPGVPESNQDRLREEVRQNLNRGLEEPSDSEVDGTPWGEGWKKPAGRRKFAPEEISVLDPVEWDDENAYIAAHDMAQAMWDAQNNFLTPKEAYDVAAAHVRNGNLRQGHLENIQDGVKKHLEGRGQKWNPALEIDFVGDDQRTPDVGADVGKVASDHPVLDRIANQKPFDIDKFPDVTEEGQGLVDQEGRPVRIGNWYRARAGGEADPLELVGFYNQDEYPGWLLGRAPDGKHKAVHVYGEGGRGAAGGMRQISPDELGPELNDWRAQRRANAGIEVGILDELNAKNIMGKGGDRRGGVPAEVGMRVQNRIRGKNDLLGDKEGIVARVVLDKGNVKIFILVKGAENQNELIEKRVGMLELREETPAPPTPEPPPPGVPNLDPNNLPDREWPVPSDAELVDRLNGFGGEVDYIKFVNAFQNPGVVDDQIRFLINDGKLEFVPEAGDGRPRVRVPGGGQGASEAVLPDGAEDEFEGAVLNAIDGAAWRGGGLQKADIVNLDDEDAGEKLVALRALVERGVLREVPDPDGGRPFFARVEVTPEPAFRNGAQNELEANILDVIDAEGSRGATGADLIDIDADDAADRMMALRELVDRRVLQRTTDGENGRPVYRRAPTAASGSRTHDPARGTNAGGQPMSHEQAVEALRGGADPMTVQTEDLYRAMEESGRFEFKAFKKNGNISGTEWAVDKQIQGPIDVDVKTNSKGRVYFIKRPNETDPKDNWRSELYAAAISQHVGASTNGVIGANDGRLYQPQTTSASGSKIIATHMAYDFPPGTVFGDATDFSDRELKEVANDRLRLALYDYLINNSMDRHRHNQMLARLPDGSVRVIVVDNGLGDGANIDYYDSVKKANFREFASVGYDNRTKALLQSIGRLNDGLTRDDIRGIVQSFAQQYGSIDPDTILDSLQRNNKLTSGDTAKLTDWLDTAKVRVDSLTSNTEAVVEAIAKAMGI